MEYPLPKAKSAKTGGARATKSGAASKKR
jgi:hypothetical protein